MLKQFVRRIVRQEIANVFPYAYKKDPPADCEGANLARQLKELADSKPKNEIPCLTCSLERYCFKPEKYCINWAEVARIFSRIRKKE